MQNGKIAVGHLFPCLIRVERRHIRSDAAGVLAQVLLINDAVIIDDEGHHARIAIRCGVSDEREAADHLAVDDIIHRAAQHFRPLRGQDLVVIAVKRRLLAGEAIARGGGQRDL